MFQRHHSALDQLLGQVGGTTRYLTNMICSPSSRRQGGAHVLTADAAIEFIGDSIESDEGGMVSHNGTAGTLPPGSASPYGVWGALGTKAGREIVSLDF